MPSTNHRLFKVEIVRKPTEDESESPDKNDFQKRGKFNKFKKNEKFFGCVDLRDESANGGGPKKSYICVDPNEAFEVKICLEKRNNEVTYGAVLFIDG